MQADWTRPDPKIADYLANFGRYGLPFNVVYGPAAPPGILLSELLTVEAVLDALREAGGDRRVAHPSPAIPLDLATPSPIFSLTCALFTARLPQFTEHTP